MRRSLDTGKQGKGPFLDSKDEKMKKSFIPFKKLCTYGPRLKIASPVFPYFKRWRFCGCRNRSWFSRSSLDTGKQGIGPFWNSRWKSSLYPWKKCAGNERFSKWGCCISMVLKRGLLLPPYSYWKKIRGSLDTGKQGMQGLKKGKNEEVKHKNNKKCFNVTLMSFYFHFSTNRYRLKFYCTLEAPKKERIPYFQWF